VQSTVQSVLNMRAKVYI